jgi:hypothetical protein
MVRPLLQAVAEHNVTWAVGLEFDPVKVRKAHVYTKLVCRSLQDAGCVMNVKPDVLYLNIAEVQD